MAPSLVVRVSGNLDDLKKSLTEGEKAIQATSAQVQKLANSFNGDRMVTHAKNVTAAIKEVGVTTLTASQASRNLDLLERAMDKMRRTSEPIPDSMRRTAEQLRFMARQTDAADASVSRVTASYRQFDGILQSQGINIGPYVKGMEDLETAWTKGADSLSLMAKAALVVTTAVGAWKLGERIGETTGLTEAIARGTSVLKGYGDVAEQTALAVADAADAVGHHERMLKLQAKSIEESTKATQEQTNELQRLAMVGMANEDHYRRVAVAQANVTEQRKKDAEAARAQWPAIEGVTERTVALTDALNKQAQSLQVTMDREAAKAKQVSDFMKYGPGGPPDDSNKTHQMLDGSWVTPEQAAENRRMGGTFDLASLAGFALKDAISRFNLAGILSDAEALKRALATLEAKEGTYAPKNNEQFFQMQRDMVLLAQLRELKGTGKIPGFADGVTNFRGGMAVVGERGPELVHLPRGADVIPNHAIGRTVNITNHIHLGGSASRADGQRIARAIVSELKAQGELMPAGAGA